MQEGSLYLVFNKQEWLSYSTEDFGWTEEELDKADQKGFIGRKNGVDCYLARPILVSILNK